MSKKSSTPSTFLNTSSVRFEEVETPNVETSKVKEAPKVRPGSFSDLISK